MKRTKGESGHLSFQVSKKWRSPVWVSFKGGFLLQKKEEKSTLILGTCNIISFCYFLLRKERQQRSSGKSEHLACKASKIGVSGAGVLLRWVSLQKKEEKDTRNTLYKHLGHPYTLNILYLN